MRALVHNTYIGIQVSSKSSSECISVRESEKGGDRIYTSSATIRYTLYWHKYTLRTIYKVQVKICNAIQNVSTHEIISQV